MGLPKMAIVYKIEQVVVDSQPYSQPNLDVHSSQTYFKMIPSLTQINK